MGKGKANKFTTDIDLCNNQIKNAAFEYWDNSFLPTDNLFEGRMLFLLKQIVVPIAGGEPFVYSKGSIIVCVSNKDTGAFEWFGLLFSKNDDYDYQITDLWKNKSGNIYVAANKEEADSWIALPQQDTYWEKDLVIVNADETHGYSRTLYVGVTNVPEGETGPCRVWDYVGVISNNTSCLGYVDHYSDLEAKLGEAENNDYIFVKADENRSAAEGGTIPPSTKYRCVVNGEEKSWQYICDTGNACIRKLGTVPGTEGEPYRLPYFFRTEANPFRIRVHSETITLDNKGTVDKDSYFLDVESATQEKAGLMSSVDKKKLDTLINDGDPATTHVWSSKKTFDELEEFKVKDIPAYINTTDWAEEENFVTYTLQVDEVKEGTFPIVSAIFNADTIEGAMDQEEAASHIIRAETYDGYIKFYADMVPLVSIPIVVKVMK